MRTALRNLFARLRALVAPATVQKDIHEEFRFHLDMRVEEYVKSGMSLEAARQEARRQFGNPTALRDRGWDERGGGFLEIVLKDLSYGLRTLRRKPLLTVTALLTLGLGIGANTAVFSVLNATLLAPLPFSEPDRLMLLWEDHTIRGNAQVEFAPANYLDIRKQSRSFEAIGAWLETRVNLTGVAEPQRLSGMLVSDNLFRLLGVSPVIGRNFLPGEEEENATPVAILAHGFWQRRFGSDPGIVGRSIQLDGQGVTVLGIMPEYFNFPSKGIDLWMPLRMGPEQAGGRGDHYIRVIGRLRDGMERSQAQSDVQAIAATLEEQYPRTNQGVEMRLVPLREYAFSEEKPALVILFSAVALVLLIGCTNVASLLLSRANERGREMILRTVLGAGRRRLLRQLITESLLLALLGGVVGLFLGFALVRALGVYIAEALPQAAEISLDVRLLAYALGLSLLTGLVFGLIPAIKVSRVTPGGSLRGVEHQLASGQKAGRNQRILVVAQLALAFVLLTGAGLLIRSFANLVSVDPGFRPEQVQVVRVELPFTKYRTPESRWNFQTQLLDQVRSLPGIRSAGMISFVPLTRSSVYFSFAVEGRANPGDMDLPQAIYRVVSPGYFETMAIALLQGRHFSTRDNESAPPVAIVNRTMAERFWPKGAIGSRLKVGGLDSQNEWLTIVGIVADVRQGRLDAGGEPQLYVPYRQDYRGFIAPSEVVVRSDLDTAMLGPALLRVVQSIDKDQPISAIETMEAIVSRSVAAPRFRTLLLGLFAGIALALSLIGTYGVVSYGVTQQTREIGLHMALGAEPRKIVGDVLRRGLKLSIAGVAIGSLFAMGLARFLRGMLFQVEPLDLTVFVSVSLVLMSVAAAACYLPALRAARLDPSTALRVE